MQCRYFVLLFGQEQARNLPQDFYGAAHMGIAWSALASQSSKTSAFKHEVLDSLNKALESLATEMAIINTMQSLLQKISPSVVGGFPQSNLDKQLNIKTTILGSYLNSIQQCIRVIKKSLRLIDVLRIDDENDSSELIVDIDRDQNMSFVDWDEYKEKSKIVYQLTFNDLTMCKDPGDQAVHTIDNTFNDSGNKITSFFNAKYLSSSYKGFELKINQVGLSRLRALFSRNKEFDDELTAQSAISMLKNERSYFNAMYITSSYDVDLTRLHPKSKPDKWYDIQINKAIELIESKASDTSLRYNFAIKEATVNKLNDYFFQSENEQSVQGTFHIAFNCLNYDTAVKFVELLRDNNAKCEVLLLVKKADLLQILLSEKQNEKKSEHGSTKKVFTDAKVFRCGIFSEERRKCKIVDHYKLREIVELHDAAEKTIELKVFPDDYFFYCMW